jgi:hypothetical protein
MEIVGQSPKKFCAITLSHKVKVVSRKNAK